MKKKRIKKPKSELELSQAEEIKWLHYCIKQLAKATAQLEMKIKKANA